jgi:hypothetical protein
MFIGAGRIDTEGDGAKFPLENVVVGKTVKRNERGVDNVTTG